MIIMEEVLSEGIPQSPDKLRVSIYKIKLQHLIILFRAILNKIVHKLRELSYLNGKLWDHSRVLQV